MKVTQSSVASGEAVDITRRSNELATIRKRLSAYDGRYPANR